MERGARQHCQAECKGKRITYGEGIGGKVTTFIYFVNYCFECAQWVILEKRKSVSFSQRTLPIKKNLFSISFQQKSARWANKRPLGWISERNLAKSYHYLTIPILLAALFIFLCCMYWTFCRPLCSRRQSECDANDIFKIGYFLCRSRWQADNRGLKRRSRR